MYINYYLNNMLMSTSVRRYETLLHTLVYYAVANIHVVYTHQLLQIESNIYTSELHLERATCSLLSLMYRMVHHLCSLPVKRDTVI